MDEDRGKDALIVEPMPRPRTRTQLGRPDRWPSLSFPEAAEPTHHHRSVLCRHSRPLGSGL